MYRYFYGFLLIFGLVLPNPDGQLLAAEKQDKGPLTGGGAHFSWVIMDAMKQELEQKTGRELVLFGRQHMLGAGCNAGIKKAWENRPGNETFGLVCCNMSKDFLKKEGLQLHPIAKEPVLILVNKSNPVNNLSLKQVRQLFSGKITNWKEVGGWDEPVAVITRLHCKHHPGHWKTILKTPEEFSKKRVNVKSAAEMVKRISDFSGAIGHTGSSWAFEDSDNVKYVSVGGIKPTYGNMVKKRYPFYRQLGIVTHGDISKDLKTMIREVQTSKNFRTLAKQYGLRPLH